jgi:hypothetical protein
MVLSQKTINIIMDPTKKSLAFSGLVTQEDMIILRSNGWIPNGEPKVLKSGRILHLWERSKPAASFGASSEPVGVTNMESIASALGGIEGEISETDFQNKLDDINEQIGRMGGGMGGGMGGRRKSRKQKKSKKYRKSKRSKKSRKSTKRRR